MGGEKGTGGDTVDDESRSRGKKVMTMEGWPRLSTLSATCNKKEHWNWAINWVRKEERRQPTLSSHSNNNINND